MSADLAISIVMPTHNRGGQLARVLDGYAREAKTAPPFEILICDDASTDDTPDRVQAYAATVHFPVRYLRQEKKGPAAARNIGARAATAPVILFTDDDCIPEPGIIQRHLAHTTNGVACVGQIVWHPDLEITPFMRFLCPGVMFNFDGVTDRDNAPYDTFYTANASLTRFDFDCAGGFDEVFPAAAFEDTEMGYRLHQAGVRFVYEPGAVVLHLHTLTLEKALARAIVSGRSAAYAVCKHPELALTGDISLLRDQTLAPRFYHLALQYCYTVGLRQGLSERLGDEWVERLEERLEDQPAYDAFRSRMETQYYDAVAYVRNMERALAGQQEAYAQLEGYVRYLESQRSASLAVIQGNRVLRAASKGAHLARRVAGKGLRFARRAARKALRTVGLTPPAPLEIAGPPYRVTYLESHVPDRLRPGELSQASVRLRNDGSDLWVPARWTSAPVNVSYHWQTTEGADLVHEGRRTGLPRLVAARDTVLVPFFVEAPDQPGTHRLVLDLVHEGVTWFSDAGAPGPSFLVTVEE
ncbi:MAG TPA: glycosyltransferase [Ktedonobacterales bacterium]|jgi:glycosyltransferase involved in cell wall biosynthesis